MREIITLVVSLPLTLLFFGLGLPLFLKKIKRNYYFGYRISHYAMLDDEIWYAVNRQGGKHLLIMSALLAINSIFAILFYKHIEVQAPILYVDLAITVIGLVYSLIKGRLLNEKMADEKGLKRNFIPPAIKIE